MHFYYKKYAFFVLFLLLFSSLFSQEAQPSQTASQPRIALVLSGGGALGYAHIGVLQAFDEAGIRPAYIAGTSMGALVGVLYAQGYSANELYDFVRQRRLHNLLRNVHASARHASRGIGSYKHVCQLINDVVPHDSFDSLAIPFLCVATDIATGRAAVRSSGNNLSSWVLASASIPVVFKPQLIGDNYYCDGGFVDNLPACHIPPEAYDLCVGVDVVPTVLPETDRFFSTQFMINDVYGTMILNISSQAGRVCCHSLIQPHHDVRYGILDFRHYEILRQRGYEAARQWIEEHYNPISAVR